MVKMVSRSLFKIGLRLTHMQEVRSQAVRANNSHARAKFVACALRGQRREGAGPEDADLQANAAARRPAAEAGLLVQVQVEVESKVGHPPQLEAIGRGRHPWGDEVQGVSPKSHAGPARPQP